MKKCKRMSALLLTMLMLLTLIVPTAYGDEKSAAEKAQQQEMQQKIDAIQKDIDAKKAEQDKAQKALNDAKKKTDSVKAQLNLLDQRDAALQGQILLLENQVALLEDNIQLTRQQEQEQYEIFCQQVRQEEERGTLSYWSVLFKATGFADLLSRIDFINEIVNYDQQVIENLHTVRDALETDKEELEEQQSELDAARKKLEAQHNETYGLWAEYKKTQEGAQAEYDMIKAEADALEGLMKEAQQAIAELGLEGQVATPGGYAWPLKSVRGVTSMFGGRASPGGIGSTNHKGVDLAAPMNTPVLAAKSGTVIHASWNGGYGECVIIQHGEGNTTLYGHLNSYACQKGDYVTQGQVIGYSGTTGNSTGPHLHFGITEGGLSSWVDPLNYLSDWYWCG